VFEDRALASYIKAWFDSTLTDYGNSESFEEFMMKHILLTLLIIVAFIGGCVFDSLITRVPPDASTRGRLMRLKHDIADFYARNKCLPESLDTLEEPESGTTKSAPKENAWGGPILYSVSNGTIVIFKTYGPGGPDATVRQEFTLQFDVKGK
jgi:hypothetical protein